MRTTKQLGSPKTEYLKNEWGAYKIRQNILQFCFENRSTTVECENVGKQQKVAHLESGHL